ncbi:non-histone chromosomal protein HMG-14A-like [Hypanus sabinus]|uniref:non-histone chromosomal protein HMG-14A-like n=1 Tax=Hypanus sabinus TaxID=79690 RepID=UPI0028C49FBA|nr:non-histone chromosomal protein HMG-14A-like [Hypanus sabinus]
MPRKLASDTVSDKNPPPSNMQLRKRQIKQSNDIPRKKPATQKKTKAKATKANPPQANQETKEDSVPSENGERKTNEVPAAGENETKSE